MKNSLTITVYEDRFGRIITEGRRKGVVLVHTNLRVFQSGRFMADEVPVGYFDVKKLRKLILDKTTKEIIQ